MLVDGNPLAVRGFNAEGLRRRGFSPARLAAVKQVHKLLYRSGLTLDAAKSALAEVAVQTPEARADVERVLVFLNQATRGIAR
jgi:UDP-N-acetylglucosamine acyltransferase